MKTKNRFNKEEIQLFEAENKVGLLATVNSEGLPHITLITTIQAKNEQTLCWGQFSEGQSKENIQKNSKTGFLIMSLDKNVWMGKTDWTHFVEEGEDYEKFNNLPMWRYNSYFGIHKVHYMNLVETSEKKSLPISKILLAMIKTKFSKNGAISKDDKTVMNPWTKSLFDSLNSLKFLSFVGKDGYPVIIPLLQCQASGSSKLAFNPTPYKDELVNLEKDQDVAIFGLTLDMEDVLTRGKFVGFEKNRGVNLGIVSLNWIYNSMPPLVGQIYPKEEIQTIVDF